MVIITWSLKYKTEHDMELNTTDEVWSSTDHFYLAFTLDNILTAWIDFFSKQPFLWLDTPQVHDDCCASHSLWPKFPHSPLIHGSASSHSPSHASLIHQGLRSCTPFITPLPQFPRSLPVTTLRSHSPGPNFPPYISIIGATCPQVTKLACTLVPTLPSNSFGQKPVLPFNLTGKLIFILFSILKQVKKYPGNYIQ